MNGNDKHDKILYDAWMDILQDIYNDSFFIENDDSYYDENEWMKDFLHCQKYWDEEEEEEDILINNNNRN